MVKKLYVAMFSFSLYTSIKFTFRVLQILSMYGIQWVLCESAFAEFINETFNSMKMRRINNVKNMSNNQFVTKDAAQGSWLSSCIFFVCVFYRP